MISLKILKGTDQLATEGTETKHTELSEVIGMIEALGEEDDWPTDLLFKVTLVVDELVQNVLDYAYDDDTAHVDVTLTSTDEAVFVEILDHGKPFDPLTDAPAPDLASDVENRRIGGLGVHFTRTLMDEITYKRDLDRNILRIMALKSP